MENEYFVDTVCWIALLNVDDELHQMTGIFLKQVSMQF